MAHVLQSGSGITLAEEHGALGMRGHRPQQRRGEAIGELHQLVGRGARRVDVTCGKDDLDVGGEQLGPGHAILRLVHHPADRRSRGIDLSLRQPQLGQAGLRLPPELAGPTVSHLRLDELAA